jgi:hypothetical protein
MLQDTTIQSDARRKTVKWVFGSLWWIFDLFSHFRVQLLAGLVLVSALLLVRRELKSSIVLAIFAGVNLSTIVPLYVGQVPIPAADSFSHWALLANVSTRSGKPELLVQVIQQFKPDTRSLSISSWSNPNRASVRVEPRVLVIG